MKRRGKFFGTTWGIVGILVLAVSGCTTRVSQPPDWITGVEPNTAVGRRIVAYGLGASAPEARDRARDDVINQIEQILIQRFEAQGGVLSDEIADEVEQVARRREEVLEPVDEYRRSDDAGGVERYVLFLYRFTDIERDVATFSRRMADSVPPAEAPEPTMSENVFDSIRSELSGAVPQSVVEQRERLERFLSLASQVVVSIQPGELTVDLGRLPDQTYTVAVSHRDVARVYPGMTLQVRVQGPEVDGRQQIDLFEVETNGNGRVQFPTPGPELAGMTTVVVQPRWLDSLVEPWYAAVADQEAVDLLDAGVERLRARSVIQVTSRAAEIPTAVVILDRDIAGNPIDATDAMRGVLQELADTGFRVRQVELNQADRERLAATERITVSDLYDVLPFEVLAQVDRVIVGNARILDFTEEDGFSVTVDVEAGAFDLRRDRVLSRVAFQERINGSDARSAIRAAFQAAGRRLARRIVPRLP